MRFSICCIVICSNFCLRNFFSFLTCDLTKFRITLNFAHVFLGFAMFYAFNVETKVIRNFIDNVFASYTFLPRGCDFRVRGVNMKLWPSSQSEISPGSFVGGGGGRMTKNIYQNVFFLDNDFPRIGEGGGGGRLLTSKLGDSCCQIRNVA